MKRSGFTMIELIFVIVIIGVLAAVAIPKLSATRDDAQISKLNSNIKTMEGEIAAYVVSQGVPTTFDDTFYGKASNTYVDMNKSTYSSTSGSIITIKDAAAGNACLTLDVNSTHMKISAGSGTTAICTAIKNANPVTTIQISGQGVKY